MSTAALPAPPVASRFALRLLGVGAVVFLANAGLLVLQLVAGKLLAPFIGSSLETWTSVIAAFLSGIALGNFLGGRASARTPTAGRLGVVLLAGVVATLWVVGLPMLLQATGAYTKVGWGVRTPLLAFVLCMPVATVLSLLTPLAIRYGVPDVGRTGNVAGTVFALSTLGCLLGNYLTGFVLIPELTINTIVFTVAGLLAVTGLATLAMGGGAAPPAEAPVPIAPRADERARPALPLPVGFVIVFCCSFAGMALELAGFRIMATLVGVSLFTWTGVIGVMLAGTCLGNWLGGKIADRVHRRGSADRPQVVLAGCLLAAGVLSVAVVIGYTIVSASYPFAHLGLIKQVLALTFVQFFLPMALLGTISPQVIRLCVHDVATAGQTAGRVYAVSTGGAIAGTLATGFLLISAIGMKGTVLLAAVLPCLAVGFLVKVWQKPAMLYVAAAVGGAFLGGLVLLFNKSDESLVAESNYYTIRVNVSRSKEPRMVAPPDEFGAALGSFPARTWDPMASLSLDLLIHSEVNLNDPSYFKYRHEQVQLESVYAAAKRKPDGQRVLVIGGGGYTFPRATRTLVPTAAVDVVEIDPAVTRVAYEHLGLDPDLDIKSFNRDGREFVAERAAPGTYDVVSLDAVNDLSVPGHLLTKEFNDAVKKTLATDGVYLVTVIDLVKDGRLWKAAYHTLKQSFKHVYFTLPLGDLQKELEAREKARVAPVAEGKPPLSPDPVTPADVVRDLNRVVIVLYASDTPLDTDKLDKLVRERTGKTADTYVLPEAATKELIGDEKELVLTDQYCPVDNLMAIVFRKR